MRKKNSIAGPFIAAAVLVGTTSLAGTAGAQTTTTSQIGSPSISQKRSGPMNHGQKMRLRRGAKGPHREHHGVLGTVSSLSGTTLTVVSKEGTSYTVDASGAKILKSIGSSIPTAVPLSDLKTGETVGVRGTVSGTSVTATEIFAGVPPRPTMPLMHRLRK